MIERDALRVARTPASRELVVLHPSLDARYTSLVASIAADVESSLSPVVAANRLVGWSIDPPRLRFRPWRDERAAFNARLARLATGCGCVVFADVRACYRSISPEAIGWALRASRCDPFDSARVISFLRRLEAIGIVGLPVGPEPSPVLANAVLASVDRSLAAFGITHLRWVDDVVAVAAEPVEAERVLALVRAALEPVGLELNERKTRVVVDPSTLPADTTVFSALGGRFETAMEESAVPVG
jgi:Reverse transcriptase (RNA-dependent DNA polymerase)